MTVASFGNGAETAPVGGTAQAAAHGAAVPGDLDALVAAAADGDRMALQSLMRTIHVLVLRYCRARIRDQNPAADDVAQEVCLAVLRALPRYHCQGRPFAAFVYTIAAHEVADARRRAIRDRSRSVDDVLPAVQREIADARHLIQG